MNTSRRHSSGFKYVSYLKTIVGSPASLRRELLRGVSGMGGLKFLNLALGFCVSILLARALGPEAFGAYGFVMSLATSLALFSYLGLPALLVREIAKYEQAQEWGLIRGLLRKSQQYVGLVSVFLMLLVSVVCVVLATSADLDRWRLLLFATPLIVIIAMETLRGASLRGLKRVIIGSLPQMVFRPAMFLMGLVVLLLAEKTTAETVIIAQVVTALVSLILATFLLRKSIKNKINNVSHEYQVGEWRSALLPFMGIAVVSFLNVEFINVLLGLIGTNLDVAMFRIATSFALVAALPLSLIETVISPYITQLYHARELEKLERLTRGASLGALLLTALPSVVFIMFGSDIIEFFYGEIYTSSYPTLVVIVLGYTAVTIVGLSMQLLYATEYHISAFRISVYGAVFTVFLCSSLIPFYGALGAGIALGFGKAVRAAAFVVEARRLLGIKTSLLW